MYPTPISDTLTNTYRSFVNISFYQFYRLQPFILKEFKHHTNA